MEKLLEINNLKTSFFTHVGEVQAVGGVSFYLNKGEALGIVGESGSGKSVTMMSLMRLLADTGKIIDGEMLFQGKDLAKISEKEMEKIRGNEIGMIFQDPMTSLNPVFNIGNQIMEPLLKHRGLSKQEAFDKSVKMLSLVGIPSPEKRMKQYPHEFSGGMRQRAMIAMALCCEPKLLIADEPTTALDVTIQAQILELMKDIKEKLNTSIILITHDLGVVADVCDRINVMYGGLIAETGSTKDLFYNPRHPYTWGLLNSIPNPQSTIREKLKPIEGQPPDLLKPPVGCPFAARCNYSMKICEKQRPPLFQISPEHNAACFLNHPSAPKVKAPVGRGSL
ncbi:ABC transporter ATP-binding protein [Clostridium sp. CM028]|uniref:ABC transporter ATP-binding protein n=1 Tax=unclassified Clostridium TaxID=2614128 RepID=UPI001C0DD951|nr:MULTISPECIES: ABC transporter ATP-binding protein [unclassified Clostridium]MBU3092482.1 ABC transporter ATP-binding protein [Clostridium sp. CF011]MBW9146930.1 ABC transporter ATP-binding protein [Clostridium sp. CM027]MBW9148026.1 ABC transporter ATP-binding protein [Clostridium sp. CM028]UVE40785.1 ABC transporter ATP-binding protein [Clostridium sp. CM027]WAG69766.1 ABC transporter ATP-binding protein [Clostridium sp. CF011]